MRWQYENVEDIKDTGELYTCTKPCKGDRLDFWADGREWLVEQVTLRCLPTQITEPIPIVGVLELRPKGDMILHASRRD